MLAETGIIVGGTAVAAGTLAIVAYKNLQEGSYLYVNARIASRSSERISQQKYVQLAHLSHLKDVVSALRETSYYPYLEQNNGHDVLSYDKALEEAQIHAFEEMKKLSPARLHPVLDAYGLRFETPFLKAIFRSLFTKKVLDTKYLPTAGVNPLFVQRLSTAKTLGDLAVILHNSPYQGLLDTSYPTIEAFDVALDKHVYCILEKSLSKLRTFDAQSLRDLFVYENSIDNILSLIRIRLRGIDWKLVTGETVGFYDVYGVLLDDALRAPSMKAFVELFKDTPLYDTLKHTLATAGEKNVRAYEHALISAKIKYVNDNNVGKSTSPYSIFAYLMHIGYERRNLLVVAKAVTGGIPKEDVQELIV
ncbi:MAG: V-type ATPase subunit [Candidatus Woesearchaeota archaeon]